MFRGDDGFGPEVARELALRAVARRCQRHGLRDPRDAPGLRPAGALGPVDPGGPDPCSRKPGSGAHSAARLVSHAGRTVGSSRHGPARRSGCGDLVGRRVATHPGGRLRAGRTRGSGSGCPTAVPRRWSRRSTRCSGCLSPNCRHPPGGDDPCAWASPDGSSRWSTGTPTRSRSSTWSARSGKINVGMLEDPVAPGDWVLIHLGFAVEVIDQDGAERALSGLELMGRASGTNTGTRSVSIAVRAGPRRSEPGTPAVRAQRTADHGPRTGAGRRVPALRACRRHACGLAGTVVNDSDGVLIEVEGEPGRPARLSAKADHRCRHRWPSSNRSASAGWHRTGGRDSSSATRPGSGTGRTLASPDVATCARLPGRPDRSGQPPVPSSLRQLHQLRPALHHHHRPALRPGRHHDGRLPDVPGLRGGVRRSRRSPVPRAADRLPRVRSAAGVPGRSHRRRTVYGDDAAMAPPAAGWRPGDILAVKGLGGYHLVCDARNETAVGGLRSRKRRGDKPFAVMVADLGAARRARRGAPARRPICSAIRRGRSCCCAAAAAPAWLRPWPRATPTLACCCRTRRCTPCCSACPGDEPGPDALVMTSGNLSGEPIVTDDAAALEQLAPLVDGWLRHDRGDPRAVRRFGVPGGGRRGAADPPLPGLRAAAAPASGSVSPDPGRRRRT